MAATDHETAVINRIWALKEAHAPLADVFAERNCIKITQGRKDPFKMSWNDGDFPEMIVSIPTTTDSLFTIGEGYIRQPAFPVSSVGWTEDKLLNAVIDVTHKDMNLSVHSANVNELLTAIRKGGPCLATVGGIVTALPFRVFRIGPANVTTRVARGRFGELATTNGVPRFASSINLPVLLRLQGSELIV